MVTLYRRDPAPKGLMCPCLGVPQVSQPEDHCQGVLTAGMEVQVWGSLPLAPCLTAGTAFPEGPKPRRAAGPPEGGGGRAQGAVQTFGSVRGPHHWVVRSWASRWTRLGALNIPSTCWDCSLTTYRRKSLGWAWA